MFIFEKNQKNIIRRVEIRPNDGTALAADKSTDVLNTALHVQVQESKLLSLLYKDKSTDAQIHFVLLFLYKSTYS